VRSTTWAVDRIEQTVSWPRSPMTPCAATRVVRFGQAISTGTIVVAIASRTTSARSVTGNSFVSRTNVMGGLR
jgi:hypothetical protein